MVTALRFGEWREKDSPVRRRAVSFLLALAIELLLVLALIIAGWQYAKPTAPEQKTFQLVAFSDKPAPDKKPAARGEKNNARAAAAAPQLATIKPKPTLTPPVPPQVQTPNMIVMNQQDFAATDISKMHGSDSGTDSGGNAGGAAYGPGAGPGGTRLFNAEWVREPTRPELAGYLPQGVAGDWADIACKTIEGNRVDNCRMLGESPVGSGLARGLRQAAWQFLIRPPRVNGKPVIGAWVRIHFDFTRGPSE